ncbi:hypothetical protein K2173_015838 [Erythroxylum novogranatense]|uniref:Glycosyltransferase n=1 Tax=Erythroxylum novogranatense TaxID=1862640 RepID=A0AAV8SEK9_9ROSI|nr:hypothetical protein K2173_015838 [Erythroxylum novogranatense]
MSVMNRSVEGHAVVLAWPFTSHPFALFNLTCKLAACAPHVQFSFISTEDCNRSIINAKNLDIPINVKSYNVDDGLPKPPKGPITPQEEAGFFVSLIPENFKRGMREAVTKTGRNITRLMTDGVLSYAVGKLAEDMKVPWVAFWVPTPYALSAHLHMHLIADIYGNGGDQTLDAIPGLSKVRIGDLPQEVLLRDHSYPDSSPVLVAMEQMSEWLPKASAVVMNSYEELNSTLLTKDLKSKFQNLFYMGFLTIPVPLPPASGPDVTGCLPWLDNQKASSVVYISFGTLVVPPPKELAALAEALEASGVPFLWSLKENFRSCLPEGFIERTRLQGKVVPWAPQSRVLAHSSIGAQVSHCGFNSLAESILGGVPLICRPVWTDNHMNARMAEEEWGIAVGIEGEVITKSGMLESLKTVFQHDKGRQMREAICALRETVLNAAGPGGVAANDFKALAQMVAQNKCRE